MVGDLVEEYSEIRAKHGKSFANLWYWKQVVTSTGPILTKLARLGLLTWVGEWLRRQVS